MKEENNLLSSLFLFVLGLKFCNPFRVLQWDGGNTSNNLKRKCVLEYKTRIVCA